MLKKNKIKYTKKIKNDFLRTPFLIALPPCFFLLTLPILTHIKRNITSRTKSETNMSQISKSKFHFKSHSYGHLFWPPKYWHKRRDHCSVVVPNSSMESTEWQWRLRQENRLAFRIFPMFVWRFGECLFSLLGFLFFCRHSTKKRWEKTHKEYFRIKWIK